MEGSSEFVGSLCDVPGSRPGFWEPAAYNLSLLSSMERMPSTHS